MNYPTVKEKIHRCAPVRGLVGEMSVVWGDVVGGMVTEGDAGKGCAFCANVSNCPKRDP